MKDTHQFISRILTVALVAGCLFLYQQKALSWDQKVQENQAAIDEAESYNQEIDAQQKQLDQNIKDAQQQLDAALNGEASAAEAEAEPDPDLRELWEDGQWTGTGEGFGGTITVTVTTSEDTITDIQVDAAADEDETYFAIAVEMLDDMLSAQSADVDTITGATFSSLGLREAVQDALSQAEVY